jgi:hypothetical protein
MSAAYEDNFGFWDIDGPEERAFFEHIQRRAHCHPPRGGRSGEIFACAGDHD